MEQSIRLERRFAIIDEWLLDLDISDRAVRLYAVLARYADSETHKAYPSRDTLATRLRCSTKSVDRAAQELVGSGAMTKQHRHNSSIVYTLRVVQGGGQQSPGGSSRVSRGVDRGVELTRTTELEPKNDIAKKARQVPIDWKPDEAFKVELTEKFPTLSVDDEVSAFVDYGQSKGAVYKDFKAAFRNWCRNAVKFHGPKTVIHQQPASKSPYVGGHREWVKDMHDMGEHFECKKGEFGCR